MMIYVPGFCYIYNSANVVDMGGLHFTSVVQMSSASHSLLGETKVRSDKDIHSFPCTACE